jgi:hypothetical protein
MIGTRRDSRRSRSEQPGSVREGAPDRSRVVWWATAMGVMWGASLATQYVAARLLYHPHLGPWLYQAPATARGSVRTAAIASALAAAVALLKRGWRWLFVPLALVAISAMAVWAGPVYAPLRVFTWHTAYRFIPAYYTLFARAWIILGGVALVVTITAQGATRAPHNRDRPEAPRPLWGRGPASRGWGRDYSRRPWPAVHAIVGHPPPTRRDDIPTADPGDPAGGDLYS